MFNRQVLSYNITSNNVIIKFIFNDKNLFCENSKLVFLGFGRSLIITSFKPFKHTANNLKKNKILRFKASFL